MIPRYGFVKLRVIKGLKTYDRFSRSTCRQRDAAPGSEEKLAVLL